MAVTIAAAAAMSSSATALGVSWMPGYVSEGTPAKYNKVGEKVGGPAPRGLDRFVLTVAGGNITVDTGLLVLGPPIGTNTINQSPEGPLCV